MTLVLDDPMVAFDLAAEEFDPQPSPEVAKLISFLYDPVGWAAYYLPACQLKSYQREILVELVEYKRESVRSLHTAGKTTVASVAVLWFATTRDAAGIDWKAPTTASAWRQLTHYLWPEIHKWARQLRWDRLGRPPFSKNELKKRQLQLKFGEAFAAASDSPASIEGAHADHILYTYDESKAIPDATFDATEGAFGQAGTNGREAYALSISTPGAPSGRFYQIHAKVAGYEDWHTKWVRLADVLAAGQTSMVWVKQRIRQWGGDEAWRDYEREGEKGVKVAMIQNRVFGNFAQDSVDTLIPADWVLVAMERWPAMRPALRSFTCLGVDVAREGSDKTIFAPRYGSTCDKLGELHGADTMQVTGEAIAYLHGDRKTHAYAVVDVVGVGGGVVDRMREQGYDVEAYNGGHGSEWTDSSGEIEFLNRRAASYWQLRELLNPANQWNVALPPDDELLGDLIASKYKRTSTGKIQVEEKDQIKRRLGRSPDRGDAVVMAFSPRRVPEEESAPIAIYEDAVSISPI